MIDRTSFEAWNGHALGKPSRSHEPGYTDEYADTHAQFAWKAWQAARTQAIEDCIRVAEQFAESYADCLGRRHAKTHAACAIVEALRLLAKG